MGNIHGKQTFYDQKHPTRRLTKRRKRPHHYDVPNLQNRYTGVPIHHFTDIFDPGTNLTNKSEELYSLPSYSKQTNSKHETYLNVSGVSFPVYSKKDIFRSRIQHPFRKNKIDPINDRTSYHYFPLRYDPFISNISRHNSYAAFHLEPSDEPLPIRSSFSIRLSNKRSASPSHIDFGVISPGVLRVVNGLPSPCSSDSEISPPSFSKKTSLSLQVENERTKHSITPEPRNTVHQNTPERTPSLYSTTEQLLRDYYSHKDKNTESYYDTDSISKSNSQFNHCSNKNKENTHSIKIKNTKYHDLITHDQDEAEQVSLIDETYDYKNDDLMKRSSKSNMSIETSEYDLSDTCSKITDAKTYDSDFSLKKVKRHQRIDFNDLPPSHRKPSCSTLNHIDRQPISNLFTSDQRIIISG